MDSSNKIKPQSRKYHPTFQACVMSGEKIATNIISMESEVPTRISRKKAIISNPKFFLIPNHRNHRTCITRAVMHYLYVEVFLPYSRHHKYVGNIGSVQDSRCPRSTLALVPDM